MKNFNYAFDKTMGNEGGFVLHKNEGDSGGWTYAGIAENHWPKWEGWPIVRANEQDDRLLDMVKEFYKTNFWDRMRLDEIKDHKKAYTIFDFGMNAGIKPAVKIAQRSVGATVDGVIGPNTINKINMTDSELFELRFGMGKIKRYIQISKTKNKQFFRGWIIRTVNVIDAK